VIQLIELSGLVWLLKHWIKQPHIFHVSAVFLFLPVEVSDFW